MKIYDILELIVGVVILTVGSTAIIWCLLKLIYMITNG